MLLTGQSNRYHNWSLSSAILQRLLEQPGIFVVDKVMSPPMGSDMSGFRPDFGKYNVVVLDYEGDEWSDPTKQAFVKYVKNGGGLVSFHATDNAFPRWPEFNEMIGKYKPSRDYEFTVQAEDYDTIKIHGRPR